MVEDEVNIVDYLAITANRVFVPEVYYGIMDNKEVFYKNRVKWYTHVILDKVFCGFCL